MADNVAEYGFRFHRGGNGVDFPKGVEMFVADAVDSEDDAAANCDIRPGDPVKLVSDGTVNLAKTTEKVYGIVQAVLGVYDSTNGTYGVSNRIPNGATGGGILDRRTRVLVVPAKGVVWEIDVNDAVTATTEAAYQAFCGENAEHVCVRALSNGNYAAFPKLAIAGRAVTAGLGWRIVGISKTQKNKDFSGANVKLLVMVNDSNEAGSAATNEVGV